MAVPKHYKKPKTIALDLGDVAITYDMRHMLTNLGKEFSKTVEEMQLLWGPVIDGTSKLRLRADLGLSKKEIHREFVEMFGPIEYEKFLTIFANDVLISMAPDFLDFRNTLVKTGMELIVLSNMNVIHKDHILEKFPELFDPHISPEKRFFHAILEYPKVLIQKIFKKLQKR